MNDVMAAVAYSEDGDRRLLGLEVPDGDPTGCEVKGKV
jgi:hypothetical protein